MAASVDCAEGRMHREANQRGIVGSASRGQYIYYFG